MLTYTPIAKKLKVCVTNYEGDNCCELTTFLIVSPKPNKSEISAALWSYGSGRILVLLPT